MEIKAKFTGTNSLGYENGKEYELKLSDIKSLSINRLDGTGKCPYESLSSFLKNWNIISSAKLSVIEQNKVLLSFLEYVDTIDLNEYDAMSHEDLVDGFQRINNTI
ncbi:hypothetical protein [Flavobacterium caseinilyticum]|uniref:Uncharacterized protein n=1 Tax=Flavobacterium caseinilyticum TaxID=2541732 RepID=A0A4R5AX71_9FLAO|nr:hypothetical protein [Flavobacterium caseinilyticum]TDD77165.1 hypothetical protein E0F89_06075 [Flavobacterium caseinilyticum]